MLSFLLMFNFSLQSIIRKVTEFKYASFNAEYLSNVEQDDVSYEDITYENYEIDTSKREVKDNGMEVKLTTLEFDLLMLFINNKNRSFSREEVLKNVWGDDYFGSDRVVDDLVRRLRKKMPNMRINTLYRYGYRLS